MRDKLKEIDGKRLRVRATFERFGTKTAFKGPPLETILLKDVACAATGACLTEHLWFTSGKTWRALGLTPGAVVEFDARVSEYLKGYKGRRDDVCKPLELDYRLERPTKARLVQSEDKTPCQTNS
jgi:hypothetical protein